LIFLLFNGSLKFNYVARLDLEGGKMICEEALFAEIGQRIRDIRTGPDRYLYILTDEPEGRLLRIVQAQ